MGSGCMNVIEITGEPILYGGQEKFLSNVVESIDMRDLHIDVLTPYVCENNSFRELIRSKGGEVYELNLGFCPGKSRKLLLQPIVGFLATKSYAVAHIHSGSISALAYGSLAAKRAGIQKVIVHSHSTGVSSLKHKAIRVVFGRILKKNATDFLACSHEAGVMKFPKSVVKNKLLVVKNGIPVDAYRRNDQIRKTQRDKYGINDDCYVIGHVGRFSQEKNHRFLIEIFKEVNKQIPNSKLLLVGDGELMDEIKKAVKELFVDNNVIFTGNVDTVQNYYQMMDCFSLPSSYEGFSLVTLEAQAAGLPCVISAGVPEDVVIGENVVRIELSDRQAWKDKVVLFRGVAPVDNTEQIKSEGYDIENTVRAVRKLYFAKT